jgi:peptidoglycan/xylan/chitin deacetylase (PgdA/CDA1 family)
MPGPDFGRRVRAAAFAASYHLGGPRLADMVTGGRMIVLMYHGTPQREAYEGVENWHGYNVPARELAAQLEYLARRCHVVPLRSALAARDLSKRRTNVVLTFDDGYENNFTVAFPALRRLGLPAAFALATGFVRHRRPLWNDVLEYAIDRAPAHRGTLDWDGASVAYTTEDLPGRVRLFNALWALAVRGDQTRRDALVAAAASQLEVDVKHDDLLRHPDYRPLQAAQVATMAASGLIEFCSHSVHHYALPHLPREVRRAELAQARADVEALSGRPCSVLCIPGGLYDAATLEDAFTSGYAHVLTSDRGDARATREVVGRNVITRAHGLHEFADLVHGPVRRVAQWLGRREEGTAA